MGSGVSKVGIPGPLSWVGIVMGTVVGTVVGAVVGTVVGAVFRVFTGAGVSEPSR
ncbi:hypothetical protein GCM10022224_001810 [Nonomuraea antimicrobica]|uniref:Uncharacterized protein n=1 Tax=Nonomuraea antimicrobica TaxID=561173 RepID=A0ABP7AXJ7_9ACTN